MRKAALVALLALLAAAAAMTVTRSGGAQTTTPPPHDFALFDGTNPDDDDVRCGSTSPFEVHGSFRAIDGPAVMRVTFRDDDFVDYPIPDDTSFSFTQAAGGTNTVDGKIVVTEQTGSIVGWLSASRHSGTAKVLCRTTSSP